MTEKYKKIILLDLDGVLNTYSGNFDKNIIPDVKSGAKEFLEELAQDYDVKIFTARNRLAASKWLIENKLDTFITDITNVKEPAYLHVDDRCICFNGNFKNTINEIKSFKAYWKQI